MNGRAWKFALVGSLVLNAFLVGGMVGGAYQWAMSHRVHAAAPAPRTALRFAAEGLSPQRQAQFLEALKVARRDNLEYVREGREARHEVLAALAAPQLDRAALDAALARTRAADTALRVAVESGVADFAASLSPQERMVFADGLRERGQWREPQAPARPAQGK
ncbi:periplasmic heavy metal sensor [Achromobacter aloeverae]